MHLGLDSMIRVWVRGLVGCNKVLEISNTWTTFLMLRVIDLMSRKEDVLDSTHLGLHVSLDDGHDHAHDHLDDLDDLDGGDDDDDDDEDDDDVLRRRRPTPTSELCS